MTTAGTPPKRRNAPLLHDDARRRPLLSAELLPDARRPLAVSHGVLALGMRRDDGPALVRGLADLDVEGKLAQELDAELRRLALRAAVTEDVGLLAAMGAAEEAHVLDDAQDRHVHLAEHVEALPRVE